MTKIMVFTKNIMAETELQYKLQTLGYEVFCTASMLQQLMAEDNNCLALFKIFIFSKTISDEEVKCVLKTKRLEPSVIFRCGQNGLENDEIESMEHLGIDYWINEEVGLRELRETLAEALESPLLKDKKFEKNNVTIDTYNEKIKELYSSLSKKERSLFTLLFNQRGESVSRKEICEHLWNDKVKESYLTQLSQITRNIKIKMDAIGLPSDYLVTKWGEGYSLANEFFEDDLTISF